MFTVTLHLNDSESTLLRKHAQLEAKPVSNFIRDVVFEKIEDQEDLETLRIAMSKDDGSRYTQEHVISELGLPR